MSTGGVAVQSAAGRGAIRGPLIAHVIYRLDVGGLENGLVNLINGLESELCRHAVVCIDDYTRFAERIRRTDVELIAIRKKPGMDPSALWRLYRVFRRLKPDIVHTRNLAALDALLPSYLAGVPVRIHSEHGWDVNDLEGNNRKLRLLRRAHAPLVGRYVALSRHLQRYLLDRVGIAERRVTQLYNGVDTGRFRPRGRLDGSVLPHDFRCEGAVVFGTVGRMEGVKNPLALVAAFAALVRESGELRSRCRLAIVGDGALREKARERVRAENLEGLVWLPGRRDDVADVLRSLDVFVLPSLAEGISNTILEAMASGLPVVATDVGGNGELVIDGVTGTLIPPGDERRLTEAMRAYAEAPPLRAAHGEAGAGRARDTFSLEKMIDAYATLYGIDRGATKLI